MKTLKTLKTLKALKAFKAPFNKPRSGASTSFNEPRSGYALPAAILSGLLLALAFPPLSQADTAFFALVPLLLAVRASEPKRGFRIGFVAGLVFWLLNLAWLWRLKDNGGPLPLVILGHAALSSYCALYVGLFGFTVSTLWATVRKRGSPLLDGLLALLAEPLLWIGADYLRGTILSGFPWNPLAATQYRNPALLHAASWAGASLVSGLIVAVNAGIASFAFRLWRDLFKYRLNKGTGNREQGTENHRFMIRSAELAVALLATVCCWMRGVSAMRDDARAARATPALRAALVHPDIPCIFEKDDDSVREANESLLRYTSFAAGAAPAICLWPETSLPGYIPYDQGAADLVTAAVKSLDGRPLLAGGVELRYGEPASPGNERPYDIYNSAFLFGPGGIRAIYRKQHLVPFGEFIPLESKIPALKKLAPTGFSCTAGEGPCVFPLDPIAPDAVRAGTLICFEDAFPYLARRATNAGADLLVTLANDAWFDGSCESEQHLAQAVLRCAENHRPMLRSTNRGVSAFIDGNGCILRRIGSGRGAGEPGFAVHGIPVVHGTLTTPYTRYGDWLLALPAAIILLVVTIGECFTRRMRMTQTPIEHQ